MTLKATIYTGMPTFRKSLLSDATALWARLRSQTGVHFHQLRTSTFRLVPQHTDESRPACIIHRLGEHSARQPFDVQLLYNNMGIRLNQFARQLVEKIRTLSPDLAMGRHDPLAVFSSERTAHGKPRQLVLYLRQVLLSFAKIARIGYLPSVGQVSKVLQSHIYTYRLALVCGGLELVLHREANIPETAVSPDCDCLDLPTNRTMQLQSDSANLGKCQAVVVQGPPQLRIAEATVPVSALEAWVAPTAPTRKERLEGLVNAMEHILKHLAVYGSYVRSDILTLRQGSGLLDKADALARHAIGIPPVLERGVVQLAAKVQVVLKHSRLVTGWQKSVLVRSAFLHLPTFLCVNVPLDGVNGVSGDIACRRCDVASGPQARQPQQVRVLLSEVVRRAPLDGIDHIRRAFCWAYSDKQVDVIRHDRKLQYPPITGIANLLDDAPTIRCSTIAKHLLSAFGRPYQVVHNQVYPELIVVVFNAAIIARMCRFSGPINTIGGLSLFAPTALQPQPLKGRGSRARDCNCMPDK